MHRLQIRIFLLKALKIGVADCRLGRDTAGRVVDEHHLQQVKPLVVEVVAKSGIEVTFPLRE